MRRTCALVAVLLLFAGTAEAQDKVKVGVLKLSSSAVLFVGVEKGLFKEFGVEPELVFFQAAAPIATALAAGQIDGGATGLTTALYNIVLGGEKLRIVADKGREWWHEHGFMKSVLPLEQVVDTSVVEAAVRAVAE